MLLNIKTKFKKSCLQKKVGLIGRLYTVDLSIGAMIGIKNRFLKLSQVAVGYPIWIKSIGKKMIKLLQFLKIKRKCCVGRKS